MKINKKEKDLILKALADNLSVKEKEKFDELLKGSPYYREEFQRRKADLDSFVSVSPPDPGENYYANLTVRVRARLEKPAALRSYVKYGFAASVILMFITVGLALFNFAENGGQRNEDLLFSSGNDEITDFLERAGGIVAFWDYLEATADVPEKTVEEALSEIETDGDIGNESFPFYDSYSIVKEINDNEFDEIYKELQNAQFGF